MPDRVFQEGDRVLLHAEGVPDETGTVIEVQMLNDMYTVRVDEALGAGDDGIREVDSSQMYPTDTVFEED